MQKASLPFSDQRDTFESDYNNDSAIDNDKYVASLVARRFDQRSMPKNRKGNEASGNEDPLLDNPVKKEAIFELPIEYTGTGFELQRDAEVTMHTYMPPSRVGGPWSGILEGRSSIGSPSNSATGSLSLDYKSSPWSKLSMGMIRGHELFYPLITFGGTLIRGGSSVGVTFYHNASYLHAMLLEHSMYSIHFRHFFPDSRWTFTSDLSRRQVLSISMSNTKLAGRLGCNLRQPKKIEVRVDVRPKLSKHRRGHLFYHLKPGRWQIGASVAQYLQSQIATVDMGLRFYSLRGLEWVLSWNRGDASVRIPILISRGMKSTNVIQALYFSMVSFIIEEGLAEMWGWTSLQGDDAAVTNSTTNALETVAKTRQDAELQRELMARQAKRRVREETEKDGLVIHEAVYEAKGGDKWDCTIPLQFWVSKSSLSLPAASKSQLLGFYNVAGTIKKNEKNDEDEKKQTSTSWYIGAWNDLWDLTDDMSGKTKSSRGPVITLTVKYNFMGQIYSITIRDKEELQLPNPNAIRL